MARQGSHEEWPRYMTIKDRQLDVYSRLHAPGNRTACNGPKDTKRAPKPIYTSNTRKTRDSLKGESLMGTESP